VREPSAVRGEDRASFVDASVRIDDDQNDAAGRNDPFEGAGFFLGYASAAEGLTQRASPAIAHREDAERIERVTFPLDVDDGAFSAVRRDSEKPDPRSIPSFRMEGVKRAEGVLRCSESAYDTKFPFGTSVVDLAVRASLHTCDSRMRGG
jgi:hypothetical protein